MVIDNHTEDNTNNRAIFVNVRSFGHACFSVLACNHDCSAQEQIIISYISHHLCSVQRFATLAKDLNSDPYVSIGTFSHVQYAASECCLLHVP